MGKVSDYDDAAVYKAAVGSLNDIATSHVASGFDTLATAFANKFTSAKDVIPLLAKYAPTVTAFANLRLLSDVAQATQDKIDPDTPRPSPRGM